MREENPIEAAKKHKTIKEFLDEMYKKDPKLKKEVEQRIQEMKEEELLKKLRKGIVPPSKPN